jgi:hypothetical protein
VSELYRRRVCNCSLRNSSLFNKVSWNGYVLPPYHTILTTILALRPCYCFMCTEKSVHISCVFFQCQASLFDPVLDDASFTPTSQVCACFVAVMNNTRLHEPKKTCSWAGQLP